MTDVRNRQEYVRFLELIALISEEWGETVKDLNKCMGNDWDLEFAEKALRELNQLQSPMSELKAVLEIEINKTKRDAG